MKRLITVALLLVGSLTLRANGDPVAERSALTLARTPVAVHVPEVKLLDERCLFTLRNGYTEVEVRYLLYNQSNKNFKALPYGFPIDWLGEGPVHWESRDIWSESIVERGWRDSYVRDVMFSLNGQSLPWQCSADTILKPRAAVCDTDFITEVRWEIDSGRWVTDPLLAPDSGEYHYSAARTRKIIAKYGDNILYYDPATCRRWYYVRFDIPSGQVVELMVRYRIENNRYEGFYENLRVFRANRYYCGEFRYDFSPAAYWGDGLAQSFSVELDTSDVHHYWQPVVVTGLPMQNGGRGYSYTARHFDLAAAEPLEVHSCSDHQLKENLPELLSRRISPDRYTITVSGFDPKYPIGNMSDMDPGTATVLRHNNQDSLYITITFHDSAMATGVLIYNGYCKDRRTWLNNSRIDTVECYYATRTNYWDTIVPEVMHEQIFYPEGDYKRELQGGEPKAFDWQSLTDAAIKIPIEERKMEYVFPWGYTDSRQKTKEITLRITAVRRGDRYNDLCVSEIIVLGDTPTAQESSRR